MVTFRILHLQHLLRVYVLNNNNNFILHQVITKGLNTRYVDTSGGLIVGSQSVIGKNVISKG